MSSASGRSPACWRSRVSDFGAFGKLFSEAIEGADRKQVEGIRASGGNALHQIRFGLMPQVFP